MPRRTVFCLLAAGVLFSALLWALGLLAREDLYAQFPSPDERHVLKVFARSQIGLPGQSGDRPGTVRLYDSQGNELNSMKVEMVQLVENPVWTASAVSVKLLLEWPLPEG